MKWIRRDGLWISTGLKSFREFDVGGRNPVGVLCLLDSQPRVQEPWAVGETPLGYETTKTREKRGTYLLLNPAAYGTEVLEEKMCGTMRANA